MNPEPNGSDPCPNLHRSDLCHAKCDQDSPACDDHEWRPFHTILSSTSRVNPSPDVFTLLTMCIFCRGIGAKSFRAQDVGLQVAPRGGPMHAPTLPKPGVP